MNICTISYHSCPYSLLGEEDTGGMNVYLRELSAALAASQDVQIDIFSRRQSRDPASVKVVSPRIRIIHLTAGPMHPVGRQKPFDYLPEFAANLERFIAQEQRRYDVVYTHYWLSGLAGEWIRQGLGAPLVHTYHTLAFLKKKALEENEHPSRMTAEHHLARAADAIISLSFEEKESLVEEYGIPAEKVRVIYPGVNTRLFHPVPEEIEAKDARRRSGQHTILYVGRIDPIKGLHHAIEAMAVLRQTNRELFEKLRLVVIGGGKPSELTQNAEFARLKKIMEQKSLCGKVFFLGSKEQTELKRYYSGSDVLIVPSLYESFGMVVLESLACGTPIIVSRTGRLKSIVKEKKNGFSFQPGRPESLASTLERFYSSRESLWPKHRIRSDISAEFSWESSAEEVYGVLDGLRRTRLRPTTISPPGGSLLPA